MVGVEGEYPGETVKAYVARKSGAKVTKGGLIEVRRPYRYSRLIEFLDDLSKSTLGTMGHELRTVNL